MGCVAVGNGDGVGVGGNQISVAVGVGISTWTVSVGRGGSGVRKGAQPERIHIPIISKDTSLFLLIFTSLLWIFSDLQVDLVGKGN